MFSKVAKEEKKQLLEQIKKEGGLFFIFLTQNEKLEASVGGVDGTRVLLRFNEAINLPETSVTVNFGLDGFQYFIKNKLQPIEPNDNKRCVLDLEFDLYKLQRRNNYRITIPEGYDLECEVVRVESHTIQQKFKLGNISAGGAALLIEPGRTLQLQEGQEFVAHLRLNKNVILECTAQLRFKKKTHSATEVLVAGVEFINLTEEDREFLMNLVMDIHRLQFATH